MKRNLLQYASIRVFLCKMNLELNVNSQSDGSCRLQLETQKISNAHSDTIVNQGKKTSILASIYGPIEDYPAKECLDHLRLECHLHFPWVQSDSEFTSTMVQEASLVNRMDLDFMEAFCIKALMLAICGQLHPRTLVQLHLHCGQYGGSVREKNHIFTFVLLDCFLASEYHD